MRERTLGCFYYTHNNIFFESVSAVLYCAVIYFFVILLAARLFIPCLNIAPKCEMKVKCDRTQAVRRGAYAACAASKLLPWHTRQVHLYL